VTRYDLPRVPGEQRFHHGGLSLDIPPIVTGRARVTEWYDNDRDIFSIDVRVVNQGFGPFSDIRGQRLAGYAERFEIQSALRRVPAASPLGEFPDIAGLARSVAAHRPKQTSAGLIVTR
jgi:hypothetical protein